MTGPRGVLTATRSNARPNVTTRPAAGSRFAVIASCCLLAISAIVWLAALRPWQWAMNDLAIYRAGSLAMTHGRDLYAVVGGQDHLHFTYPPFAAAFLAPLAELPWSADRLALTAMTVGGYACCLNAVIRRLGLEGGRWPTWWLPVSLSVAIWLEPFRATVSFGQINVVLMTMVITDLLVVRGDERRGWLIGVAAAVKLTPLAFVPFLLATGRRRAAGNAIAGFAACALIGFVADPSASREYWGRRLFLEPGRVGRVENASNQTVRGILARLLRTADVPGWWLAVAVVICAIGLLVAVQLHRSGHVVWSVTAMAITMLCVSPISWSHHWVWSGPMLLVCADLIRRRPAAWTPVAASLVMVPFFAALIFWPPHADHLELHDTSLQQLMSASYVTTGILLVAVLAATARRRVDS